MGAVWNNRFAKALAALAALKESTALELLPDLMPVLPLADAQAMEHLLVRGERTWGGRIGVDPAAGQFAQCTIVNPVGSGVLVTVEDVHCWHDVAAFSYIAGWAPGVQATGAVNESQGRTLDMRPIDTAFGLVSQALLRGYSQAASGALTWLDFFHTRDVTAIAIDIASPGRPRMPGGGFAVLPPGAALDIRLQTADIMLNAFFRWRERVLDTTNELVPPGA